ncbi:hypothetical protein KJ819_03240 [Patescibacteria group bacterium]|nr:hypothetical protein [Patescibacteria group bacterium]MBU1500678.1 hypothetical protein [Patescibacteria group bacterium]MBU2080769.1 hypothetical protein [Patescibacteria group bacterium]MBU2123874.1 hypothetical protein [Patescibacteria group bacterium]MBU2194835.1 hypothetical protein [Patescibacteria group bacterium]
MKPRQKKWAYQNTALTIASIGLFIFLADTPAAHAMIEHIGSYGYLGSFIAGIFFVSTFTVAPSAVVLFHLAEEFHPVLIALTAGAGGVIGDLLIFRFVRGDAFAELSPLIERIKQRPVFALFKSSYFGWFTPVLGALIIASPLPDEAGIGLMGLSKMREWQFMLLTYVLNTTGILIIVLLAQA